MPIVLVILHVIVCLFLIFIVLLQRGKGVEMGAAFGGSSQTLFGSRGASTFLNKLTTVSAVVFMLTSLALTIVTMKSTSVIRDTAPVDERKAIPQSPALNANGDSVTTPEARPGPRRRLTRRFPPRPRCLPSSRRRGPCRA